MKSSRYKAYKLTNFELFQFSHFLRYFRKVGLEIELLTAPRGSLMNCIWNKPRFSRGSKTLFKTFFQAISPGKGVKKGGGLFCHFFVCLKGPLFQADFIRVRKSCFPDQFSTDYKVRPLKKERISIIHW